MLRILEMYSLSCDLIRTFLDTYWKYSENRQIVNKAYKTHKKHRIDRIQTQISLKIL